MIPSFKSDYITGTHPKILEALGKTNSEPLSGYGEDKYCDSAKKKIEKACGRDDIDVFFLVGGTQTNSTVISAVLKAYEGVIAADTGHVSLHEAGAVEYTGHKVLNVPSHNGKIDSDELDSYIKSFYDDENHEHMVFPGMVYISHPTEFGTLYSKNELKNISAVCKKYKIPLYLDGARLGYGVMSNATDVTLSDIAEICDAFYIGGTKVGALCGEAVIFKKTVTPKYFMTIVKQHGAMLAKGRLLGIQFDTLFTDNLYFEISRNAIVQAEKVKNILKEKNYEFAWESPTNQQFVILDNEKMEKLKEKVVFDFWEKLDEKRTVVRFCTCWSTTDEDVEYLNEVL